MSGESFRRASGLHPALIVTGLLGCVYTAVVIGVPSLSTGVVSPAGRVVLEVTALFLVLVATLMLSIPNDEGIRPGRNAFIAALVVIAATNAVLGVTPALGNDGFADVEAWVFYPWVAARYVAGLLFVLAGFERPRLPVGGYVAGAVATICLIDAVLVASAGWLPTLVESAAGGAAVNVLDPAVHAVIQLLPASLFVVGAVVAMRLHRRSTGAPVLLALSIALLLQSFTQIHQVLFPSLLGPLVTSADVFRLASFVALFIGALLQVRLLYAERSSAVRVREADLLASDVLAGELTRVLDREENFRALVSHELATPVATIGALGHVLRELTRQDDGRVRDTIASIRGETRRLSELIERIDELRDLELADFTCDLRPVRLHGLLDEAARFGRALPGGHPVQTESVDVRVWADPVRFGQALRNILANAARYAPEGSPILIRASEESGRIIVAVSDHGPGIPEGERAAVVRPFARGVAGRGVPGTGLGLHVASRIIQAHGGVLLIEDTGRAPATGTRVCVDVAKVKAGALPENG